MSWELFNNLLPLLVIIVTHLVFTLIKGKSKNIFQWFENNTYSLYLIISIYMIPVAISSRLKWGGDLNSLSICIYFFILTAFALLAEVIAKNQNNQNKKAIDVQKLIVIGVSLAILYNNLGYARSIPSKLRKAINNLDNNKQEISFEYMRNNPNIAYFPDYPLSTAMAEGKIYHSMKGLADREAGKLRLTDQHFRDYIPSQMKYLVFADPQNNRWQKERIEIIRSYLPEYSQEINLPDLQGWLVYQKANSEVSLDEKPKN